MSRWVDLDDDCHRFCGPDGYYERWYIDPDGINEQTDDLINRKTTIEYLRLKATRIGAYGFLTAEEIKKYIDGMPSEGPERKTGRWIPVTKTYEVKEEEFPEMRVKWIDAIEPDEEDAVRCSECGTVFSFDSARNWCSECGARMETEEDK